MYMYVCRERERDNHRHDLAGADERALDATVITNY